MENFYNETDAAIYAHKNISTEMQKKYTIEQIEYLLDLVYEYYESFETEIEETNVTELTTYINANIKQQYCKPITHTELAQLLDADNLYMESIGLIEPEENAEDLVYIHNIINDIYPCLSDNLKIKYTKDNIYVIILREWEYLDVTDDVDEIELYKYIQKKTAMEGINISIDDIEEILLAEENFLLEE
jgi:hypothetical protein